VAESFENLKRDATQDFEKILALTRPNLGTQKSTRLRRAGCGSSETLLHRSVAKVHGEILAGDYVKRLGKLTRNDAHERLRFLMVLHSVVDLQKKTVIRAVKQMETALSHSFDGSRVWMLGSSEVEIVNIALLKRIGSAGDDEARKLNVLERLQEMKSSADGSSVLVHFHGIVDLGTSSLHEDQLRERLAKVAAWQRSSYQIELKRLFKDNTVERNLRSIANYVTKGGNDQLRYGTGFGRDPDEDLDAKIWRAGTGRADKGGETVLDERGLTLVEIALLDGVWSELMARKRDKRGYLLKLNGARRP